MEVTAGLVKDLREKSGAGMMDCKKALSECNGDIDAAMDYLREKGIAKAEKKGSRIAAEGNSETDFVSKNEEFTGMIDTIGKAILKSNVTDLESALEVSTDEDGTVGDLIIAKTAKIGEKLSLRRIEVIEKNSDEGW